MLKGIQGAMKFSQKFIQFLSIQKWAFKISDIAKITGKNRKFPGWGVSRDF